MVSFIVSFFYLACLLVPQDVTTFDLSLYDYDNGKPLSITFIKRDEYTWLAQPTTSESFMIKISGTYMSLTKDSTINMANFLAIDRATDWHSVNTVFISVHWANIESPIMIERGEQQIVLKQSNREKPVVIQWKNQK